MKQEHLAAFHSSILMGCMLAILVGCQGIGEQRAAGTSRLLAEATQHDPLPDATIATTQRATDGWQPVRSASSDTTRGTSVQLQADPLSRLLNDERSLPNLDSPAEMTGAARVVKPSVLVAQSLNSEIDSDVRATAGTNTEATTVDQLIQIALVSNPGLRRRALEVDAAWDRVPQVRALPDPMLGVNGFGSPIETAAGGQRANMSLSQRLPWIKRLDAQGQQAMYQAMALEQVWRAEQLKIRANVKITLAQLYVLGQQVRINLANQKLLDSLIEVSTLRVGQGIGSQGDVLLTILELSRLSEDLLELRQRQRTLQARLNELLNRPTTSEIEVPVHLETELSTTDIQVLQQLAYDQQPEVVAARLRAQATAWGIEIASLARMPEFSINLSWFFIDNNRPPSTVVEIGEDAWSLGATFNLPIWPEKYEAMESEASRRYFAAGAATEAVIRRYESLLADLLAQHQAAAETVVLYDTTILPHARQTLEVDQQSYSQGKVEFDRIIRDIRTIISLEVGYHRARGNQAIANAGIQQATGAREHIRPAQGL